MMRVLRPSTRFTFALCALAAAILPPAARAGSPFYLTIERSFASGEHPEVRLDFTDAKTPLVLRILRPRDVDHFLDGQLHVSRSYEEPLAAINPGHYLMRGLNAVDSPLPGLRALLDPELRRSFRDDVLRHALEEPPKSPAVTEPAEITQDTPQGFDLVREDYIDLQKGGAQVRSLYGWDADWSSGNRYQVRQIVLDPLPDGLYLLEGIQDRAEAQALLQVSSLSMQVKQASQQLIVRVVGRDRQPVEHAAVSYRDARGRWQPLGETHADGELSVSDDGGFDGQLLVRATTAAGHTALAETDFLPATNAAPSVFIVTDRPIFKPGETFFYKGTVRTRVDGELAIPTTRAGNATVHLLRQDGSDAATQVVPLSDFGSFSGSFALDPTDPPGLYRLAAELDDRRFAGELRVRDYVKPTFYLELLQRDPMIRPGATFHLAFRAKRYAGGIPPNVKYEVFVYRKKFEAPEWVAESGGGLEAGHDYFGAVRSATALSQPQRLYSSVEARVAAGRGDSMMPWASAPEVDRDGTARIEVALPQVPANEAERDWIYSVMVRAMDQLGAQAVLTENVYATASDAAVSARFDPVVSDGREDLQLWLRTTYPDGSAAPDASGHIDVTLESATPGVSSVEPVRFRSDAHGVANVTIKTSGTGGRVRAVAVLEAVGDKPFARPFTADPAIAVVVPSAGEAVVANTELELHPDRTVLAPGARARVLALLPTGWGAGETGTVWQTIAGEKVFATSAAAVSGRSRWFEVEAKPEYGTGFYQTVTLPIAGGKYEERTVGFRVVPSDKRLAIRIHPASETAEPLKPFQLQLDVVDGSDRPAPDTELAVTIVDRAVYAVQPELRPPVLDYFYPLPRLSLGTFYSDELQGYGYAAQLLRPNFRLSALKANVQPLKRDMRDTAGWFPHVVTDAGGYATVTAQMPANVTEWLVTAIAIDRSGRAGEGTQTFRTTRDVDVEPLVPHFLREGDVVDGHVQLQNHTPQPATLAVDVAARDGASLDGQTQWPSVELAPNGSAVLPARLTGTGANGTATLALSPTATALHTGGASAFDIDLHPAAMVQRLPATASGGVLTFAIPAAASAGKLDVVVLSGLLGASLRAAAELVQYPFGCTEQLAHTTFPNLLLIELADRAHLDPEALQRLGLASSVERARANARLGVQRLLANQKADGGFGAWPIESTSTFDMTLLAARVLRLAESLQIDGSARAAQRSQAWLTDQLDRQHPPLGTAELEILNEIGLHRPTTDQSAALIKATLANEHPALVDLIASVRILQVRGQEYWFRSQLGDLNGRSVDDVVAILTDRLKRQPIEVSWRERCAGFRDAGFCPGEAGEIAAVYAALDAGNALDEDTRRALRQRLFELMRNGWWQSTYDTADVLFHLRPILARETAAPVTPAGARVARAASGLSFPLSAIPGAFIAAIDVDQPHDVARIEIDGLAEHEIASATLTAEVPFAAVQRLQNGLRVRRTLLKVGANGVAPVDPDEPLPIGTTVVSQVVVERGGVAFGWLGRDVSPSDFIVVEDAIPAIGEAIDDDRTYLADAGIQGNDEAYWAMVKDTRRYADRTTRVVRLAPGASFTAYQVWRVAYGGSASLPPPRAFDMYDGSIAGNDVAATVVAR